MSAPAVEPADLLDLKFLPAWVKEPGATNHYDHYTAEEAPAELRSRDRGGRHKDQTFRSRERRGHTQHPGSRPDRRAIDIEQILLCQVRGGRFVEVVAVPTDQAAFDAFWA